MLPLTWLVNGAPITSDPRAREIVWQPDGSGFVKLSVVDAKGRVDRVTVRITDDEENCRHGHSRSAGLRY